MMRILLIEDSEDDARLIEEEFIGAESLAVFRLVSERKDVEAALDGEAWDVIISDFDLGAFQAPDVLAWIAERRLDIPFLVVSGVLTEELAVSALKAGAHDFCTKNNLARLVPAAQREWKDACTRRQKRAMEEALRHADEAIHEKDARLREAEKLEAIGKLAGGIAHDFNNLMTSVIGYGRLAQNWLEEGHPVHGALLEILKAGEQAAQLTQKILAFGQKQILHPKLVDLNEEIRRRLPFLTLLAGDRVRIDAELAPGLDPVSIDPQLAGQVLATLVVNARESVPGRGSIQIRTSRIHLDGHSLPPHSQDWKGKYAVITVEDDGMGMDPSVAQRVFEPYFTTKQAATRMGLGLDLAAVHGIVSQSGGSISVESAKGKGSRFSIHLPFFGEAGGRGTILIADGEVESRALARRILEPRGFGIIETLVGGAAFGATRNDLKPFDGAPDVVLLDVDSLGISLLEYRSECAAKFRGSPVIFLSKSSPGQASRRALPPKCRAPTLQKPFQQESLLKAVTEASDGCHRCSGACLV